MYVAILPESQRPNKIILPMKPQLTGSELKLDANRPTEIKAEQHKNIPKYEVNKTPESGLPYS